MPYYGDTTDQDFALVCFNCAEQPDFTLAVTPASASVCAPADGTFTVDVGRSSASPTRSRWRASGNPAGTTTGFTSTR